MIKREEGITLIQTAVAVVMIVLIASFAILNSTDTVVETKIAKLYSEIMIVKKAVMEIEALEEEGMEMLSSERILSFDGYEGLEDKDKANQEYYFLNFKEKSNLLNGVLDIRNVENNYIVNVKDLDNIEIFSVDGIEIGEEKFYTDDEIIEKYNEIFAGR